MVELICYDEQKYYRYRVFIDVGHIAYITRKGESFQKQEYTIAMCDGKKWIVDTPVCIEKVEKIIKNKK